MKFFPPFLLVLMALLLIGCTTTNPSYVKPYLNRSYSLSQESYLTQISNMSYILNMPDAYFGVPSYQEYLKNPSRWQEWHYNNSKYYSGTTKSRIIAILPKKTQFILNEYVEVNIGGGSSIVTIASGPYKGIKAYTLGLPPGSEHAIAARYSAH